VRLACRATMLFGLVCLGGPAAHAEYAVLSSGARLHITGYERMGDTLRLHLAGGNVDMPAGDVLRIEPEEVFAPVVVKPVKPAPALQAPYAELIKAAALKYGLDPQLIASMIKEESNFNPRAISRKNAQGLMQLLPETSIRFAVRNPFDPAQSIEAGVHYMRQLLDQFSGNVRLALAAYNSGPDCVNQFGGIPPYRETRAYVEHIMLRLGQASSINSLPASSVPAQSLLLKSAH
jgi:hypothetical protein